MKKPITLAQLGCGYWGPNLLRNFSSQKDCHVKYVAEMAQARRDYVESNFPKTKTTADWNQVIEDTEVDGVIIATGAATHYDLAKAALQNGKHVFVEKPLALTVKDADDLVAIAKQKDRVLMVGHTFLYNPAVRFLKNYIEKGELGRTFYIYSQRLNLGQVRSDVNVWWNLAPHDVSILLYLMNGELPTTVTAHGMDYIQKGIQDVAFVVLSWEDRTVAHIQASWLDPGKVRRLTVVGSRKMLVYDDVNDDKIAIYDKGIDRVPVLGENMHYDDFSKYKLFQRAGDILIPKIEFQEPLRLEASHFLECIRENKTALTGPEHARDVVAVLEAGQHSLETGKPVKVGKPLGTKLKDSTKRNLTANS